MDKTAEANPEYMAIGKRLLQLRNDKGLNQTQVIAKLDIYPRTYQNYEYGRSKPNRTNIKKIIDYYGCSLGWLISGEGVPYPDRPGEQKLTRDMARSVSRNITNVRDGGLDADLFSLINGAIQEYRFKNKEKYLRGIDAGIAMMLQVIYRELKRAPAREEILNLIEALQIVGKVYPRGVPLTPVESAQLLAWGSVKAPPIDHEIVCWEPEETPSNDR